MTTQSFFVAADAQGHEFLLYGDPAVGMRRGSFDVVVSRGVLDTQNLMLWRQVVAKVTGVWPMCEQPVCHHENRHHEGPCRTDIVPSSWAGGGHDAA